MQQTGKTERHATEIIYRITRKSKGGENVEERRHMNPTGSRMDTDQSLRLRVPRILELPQSSDQGGFGLLVIPLSPRVLSCEWSAYNIPEPKAHDRDLGAKTKGRRVKLADQSSLTSREWKAYIWSLADYSLPSDSLSHPSVSAGSGTVRVSDQKNTSV